jgi:hypothetical protein
MSHPSVAALAIAIFAAPSVAGIQLVETKGGKVYEASEILVVGDKLRMSLVLKGAGQTATIAIPIDSVLPENVYYAWAAQVAEADVEGHLRLAEWCRKQGIFRQAWRQYIAAAEASDEVKKRLPELEREISEEAATWQFERAETSLREGEVHAARVLAERILEDYPNSKEVPRTNGLLKLIAEREQFLSEQKVLEQKAELAKRQRRYLEKELESIDTAKLTLRNTQMRFVADARMRLRRAAYALRRSLHRLDDLAPFVDEPDLRKAVEAVAQDTEKNMVASFTRLADLRYLSGDIAGALDAAHEVLWVDADNKAMTDMRKRVLDSSEYGGYRFRYGYYDRYIVGRWGYLPPFACPYSVRYGYGIRFAAPYRLRAERITGAGNYSFIRYVR